MKETSLSSRYSPGLTLVSMAVSFPASISDVMSDDVDVAFELSPETAGMFTLTTLLFAKMVAADVHPNVKTAMMTVKMNIIVIAFIVIPYILIFL